MTAAPITYTPLDADVVAAQQGDIVAFERLVLATQNTVTSLALAIVKDVSASEDVAQNVFIQVWRDLKTLKSTSSFLPWLRQITRNLAKNFLRDNKVSRQDGSEAGQTALEQAADNRSPERITQLVQAQTVLIECIESLPFEHREIVLLYYREQQDSQQVARLLDLSPENVRKVLSRVRQQLKAEVLAKYGQAIAYSAPTVALTGLVVSTIASGPVAAATFAQSFTTATLGAQVSWLAKLATLFSGALIGTFAAILAVFWSSHRVSSNLDDSQSRQQVIKRRNLMIAWLVISGLALTFSYQFTGGWLGPVIVYSLFGLGFGLSVIDMHRLLKRMQSNCAPQKSSPLLGYGALVIGLCVGGFSLYAGLLSSGRL